MSAAAKAENFLVPQELRATEGLGVDRTSGDTGTCPEGQGDSQLVSFYSSTGNKKPKVSGLWSLRAQQVKVPQEGAHIILPHTTENACVRFF